MVRKTAFQVSETCILDKFSSQRFSAVYCNIVPFALRSPAWVELRSIHHSASYIYDHNNIIFSVRHALCNHGTAKCNVDWWARFLSRCIVTKPIAAIWPQCTCTQMLKLSLDPVYSWMNGNFVWQSILDSTAAKPWIRQWIIYNSNGEIAKEE